MRGQQLKSYCKGLRIDEAFVARAYDQWAHARAGRKNAWRVTDEHGSSQALVSEIAREVADRSLSFRPIKRYQHIEPTNGKARVIGIESVKQQVCDYAAVLALEDLLAAKVGFWQVASVRGKGQVMAANACRRWVRRGGYYVHLDVRKCYPSISAEVVMGILKRYVRSADVLYLCRCLLDTYGGGLEIGSYFALRMAQLVLSFGYHEVEGMCKYRRGRRYALVAHQLWYADDIYLFSADKRDLRKAARALARFLREGFGLSLKPWKVCRASDDEPIDAVGFTVRKGRTTLRSSLFLRACRVFRRYKRKPDIARARRVTSYWGWFCQSDSASVVRCNGFGGIARHARALIGAYERSMYEHDNAKRYAA